MGTSLDLGRNCFQTASPNNPIRATTRGVEYSRVSPTSHALLALQRMPEAHPNGVQPPSPPAGTDRATATKHLLISLPSQKGVPAFGQRALQTTGIDFTPAQLGCLHRTDELHTQSYTAVGNRHTRFTFRLVFFFFLAILHATNLCHFWQPLWSISHQPVFYFHNIAALPLTASL